MQLVIGLDKLKKKIEILIFQDERPIPHATSGHGTVMVLLSGWQWVSGDGEKYFHSLLRQ